MPPAGNRRWLVLNETNPVPRQLLYAINLEEILFLFSENEKKDHERLQNHVVIVFAPTVGFKSFCFPGVCYWASHLASVSMCVKAEWWKETSVCFLFGAKVKPTDPVCVSLIHVSTQSKSSAESGLLHTVVWPGSSRSTGADRKGHDGSKKVKETSTFDRVSIDALKCTIKALTRFAVWGVADWLPFILKVDLLLFYNVLCMCKCIITYVNRFWPLSFFVLLWKKDTQKLNDLMIVSVLTSCIAFPITNIHI